MSDIEKDNDQIEVKRLPFYENGWFWVSIFFMAVCVIGSITGDFSPRKTDSLTDARYFVSDTSTCKSVSYDTTSSNADVQPFVQAAGDSASEATEIESSETTTEKPWDGKTVYITPTGEKFHIKESCAGKNATKTSLTSAKKKNYTACKRCASQATNQEK